MTGQRTVREESVTVAVMGRRQARACSGCMCQDGSMGVNDRKEGRQRETVAEMEGEGACIKGTDVGT